jgi:hypothetical protein
MVTRDDQLELRPVLKEVLSHEAGRDLVPARQRLDAAFGPASPLMSQGERCADRPDQSDACRGSTRSKMTKLRASALVIGTDSLFNSRTKHLGALAARYRVPAVYEGREFAQAGGLISYGGDVREVYRIAGTYASQVLKGRKPADLPVQESTKIELIINLKVAKALGLNIPSSVLARADEVIE